MNLPENFQPLSMPYFDINKHIDEIIRPKLPDLKLGPTVQEKIDEQTDFLLEMNEKQYGELSSQTTLLKENCTELGKQTELLKVNYAELEKQTKMLTNQYRELYGIYQHLQDESIENQKELTKSKHFNYISMGISILAVIVATCSWLFPGILGG